MSSTLLNYNPYDGKTHIELKDQQVSLLANIYQEILNLPEKPDLDLIKSYQPSWNWYQGFKAMDRIDVRVYNYDLLNPGFDLLSMLQANHEGKLNSQIRNFVAETAVLGPGFDASDPMTLKIIKDRTFDSPFTVLIHKFTGQDPNLIMEELIELANLENSNPNLLTKYNELFNLISDLYQTMILEIPPLESEIILFGSDSLSVVDEGAKRLERSDNRSGSSFPAGTLDIQDWDYVSIPQIIYVPAGSRVLPYYQTLADYRRDRRIHFLLSLGTQAELIDQRRIRLNLQWALELHYNKATPRTRLLFYRAKIDQEVKIYRTDNSSTIREPDSSQFESSLKVDLTTIDYNHAYGIQFPSRLSPDTTYTYDLQFYEDDRPYQLVGNTADLFYRIKKFVTQEEPGPSVTGDYLTGDYVTGDYVTGDYVTGDSLDSFLNSYLPTEGWLAKTGQYIRSNDYRVALIQGYNNNGDRLINGYLREQLTFHQFLLRYVRFPISQDSVQKAEDLEFLMTSDKSLFNFSQELENLLLQKLEINYPILYLDLLEYAFFGTSRDPALELYQSLNYQLSVDLQNLILEAPPLDQELIVYRGIKGSVFDFECQPGEQFTMEGMISTSLNLRTASTFGCHLFIIRVPAGRQALPLNLPQLEFKEREILLPHGSTFVLDQCVDVPYLETVEFYDQNFLIPGEEETGSSKVCSSTTIHFYFCHLVDQPKVGP